MRTDRDLYVTDNSRLTLKLDLFRQGNASGPRLDHVRFGADRVAQRKVVDVRPYLVNGELWVPGQTGGISTFDRPTADELHWWCIPAGTELPAELVARRDHTLRDGRTHYSLAPGYDMPLSAYRAALAALHDRCRRIS
jgi:hypothetical protein